MASERSMDRKKGGGVLTVKPTDGSHSLQINIYAFSWKRIGSDSLAESPSTPLKYPGVTEKGFGEKKTRLW